MNCPKKEILLSYLDRECTPREHEKITEHIKKCRKCEESIASIAIDVKSIKDRSRFLEPETIPIKRVIPIVSPGKREKKRTRWWVVPVAAAAIVGIMFSIVSLLLQPPPPTEAPQDFVFSASLEGQPASTFIFKQKDPEMTVIWITRL